MREPTLRTMAGSAVADLHSAVAAVPLPVEPPTAGPRRRRLQLALATAVAVILIAAAVSIIDRNHRIAPTGSKTPAGFRTVDRPEAGFSVAVPAAWEDAPNAAQGLYVYRARERVNGSELTVSAQDIGAMSALTEAQYIAHNAANGGTGVTTVADASTGRPGYRVDWVFQSLHTTAFVVKAGDRAYVLFFHLTTAPDMASVTRSFRLRPLPPVDSLPTRVANATGFSIRVPAAWVTQPSTSPTPGITSDLIVGGIEGAVIVNRAQNTAKTPEQVAEDAKARARGHNGVDFQTRQTQLGGKPAVELDWRTTARDPRFVTAPGNWRGIFIRDGQDVVGIFLADPGTARTHRVLDRVISSYRAGP